MMVHDIYEDGVVEFKMGSGVSVDHSNEILGGESPIHVTYPNKVSHRSS